ncbi:MAG: hypothetical protein ABIA04_11135 [Pseudomonadota bacterium]
MKKKPYKIHATDCDGCYEGVDIMLISVGFKLSVETSEDGAKTVVVSSGLNAADGETFDVSKLAGKSLQYFLAAIKTAESD